MGGWFNIKKNWTQGATVMKPLVHRERLEGKAKSVANG